MMPSPYIVVFRANDGSKESGSSGRMRSSRGCGIGECYAAVGEACSVAGGSLR